MIEFFWGPGINRLGSVLFFIPDNRWIKLKARHIKHRITRHSYWLAVALPLLLPLGWALRDAPGMSLAFAWLTPLTLYVLVPVMDLLLGRDLTNPDHKARSFYTDTLVPACATASYLAVLTWALVVMAKWPDLFHGAVLAGWVISLANIGATIGINVGHELIHRRTRPLRLLGGFLFATVSYACFKLEHPRWHHVKVATFEDPSSAPYGSTIFTRVPRAWLRNTQCGWQLAADDAEHRGHPRWWNEMLGWYAISAGLALGIYLWLGTLPALVFIAQGLGAAALLEVINYVEHYGLYRKQKSDGRLERPATNHSWDSDFWLSNALLIQLPRHADHHVHPSRPFNALQYSPQAPRLPVGYSTAVLLAFFPPLWRRIIHPHLPS